jgi:hypothetical protein
MGLSSCLIFALLSVRPLKVNTHVVVQLISMINRDGGLRMTQILLTPLCNRELGTLNHDVAGKLVVTVVQRCLKICDNILMQ